MAKTYWKNAETWCCEGHFPPALYHRLAPRCAYTNCNSYRPNIENKLKIVELKLVEKICAWENCSRGIDGKPGKQRPRSKYCSIQCKNDYARHRYRLRKMLKRTA